MENKLNLGCGFKKIDGYIGIDISVNVGADIEMDVEKNKLPFEDDSVDEIISNHFLEHLKETKLLFNECWRVLKKGKLFKSKVPYGLWDGACKPCHYQTISACWFDWFRRENLFETYGYKSWDVIKIDEIRNKNGEIYEIYCEMTPRK